MGHVEVYGDKATNLARDARKADEWLAKRDPFLSMDERVRRDGAPWGKPAVYRPRGRSLVAGA